MMVRGSFVTKIALVILLVKVRYESENPAFRVMYPGMCDRIIAWAKEKQKGKYKKCLKIVVY